MKFFSLPTALVTAGLASIALAAAPVGAPVEATTLDVSGTAEFNGQQILWNNNNASFGNQMYYGGNIAQYGGDHKMYYRDPVTNIETRVWIRPENCALRIHMTNFTNCGDVQYLRPGRSGFVSE